MADFLQGCMADLKTNDQKSFEQTFCARCKNPECERAGWSRDRFSQRVATQAERLLHPKNQITQDAGSRYEALKDFVDMSKQAIRLEIADRRGDWTVPGEEEPLQPRGFVDVASRPATRKPEPEPEPEAEPEPEPTPTGGPAPRAPPASIPQARNTPKPPPEGIMIGGGPAPATPQEPPPRSPAADDWSPKPTVTKVAPGARIKLGGK